MENELKRVGREIALMVGLIVIALIIGGLLVWTVYSVIGTLTDNGRHWLAVGLIFAVPGAYLLGLQVARSHRAGFERGLDLKLSARDRERHTARPTTLTAQPPAAAKFDDLLPKMGQAVIVTRADDSHSPIDL